MPSFDEFMISLGDSYRDYLYKNPLQRTCMCRKKEIRLPDVKPRDFLITEDDLTRDLEVHHIVDSFILAILTPDDGDGFYESLIRRDMLLRDLEETRLKLEKERKEHREYFKMKGN